jgi:hypothetical protein
MVFVIPDDRPTLNGPRENVLEGERRWHDRRAETATHQQSETPLTTAPLEGSDDDSDGPGG